MFTIKNVTFATNAKLFKLLAKKAVLCQTIFLWRKLLNYAKNTGTSTRFVCSANVGVV